MDFHEIENSPAMGRIVCPKPCRLAQSITVPFRFQTRNDVEAFDLNRRAELLGVIPRKDGFESERYESISSSSSSSSPPFCYGSPPCRTSNPLIQDAHFGVEKLTAIASSPSDSASLPSARSREHFGKKQSAVIRVEGFGCQSSHFVAMG